MKQIVTGNEIKEIEKYVIGRIGIPSLVLMERAALSISEKILMQFTARDKICVVCGSGNNGCIDPFSHGCLLSYLKKCPAVKAARRGCGEPLYLSLKL